MDALLSAAGPGGAGEARQAIAETRALIEETGACCRDPVAHEVSAEIARVLGER